MATVSDNASVSASYSGLVVGGYYMLIPTTIPRRTNCGWSGGSSTTFNLSGGTIINRSTVGQYSVQQFNSSEKVYVQNAPVVFTATSTSVSVTYNPAIQTCKGYGGKWLLYRIR